MIAQSLLVDEKIIEAKLKNLPIAIDFISQHAKRAHCSDEVLWKIQLAAEETFVNIIKHGYKKETGIIGITCSYTDVFIFSFTDEASPYDPTLHRNSTCDDIFLHSIPIRGYGIELIKSVIDEIQYMRQENKNILTLKKTLISCNSSLNL